MHLLSILVVALGVQSQEVEFEGRSAFSKAVLMRVIDDDIERYRKNPRPAPLDDAIFRLGQYYRSRGYVMAQVDAEATAGKIVFKIREGPLVKLGRLHFEGNSVFKDSELKELLDQSASGRLLPYSRKLLALQSETILAAYSVKGYIEATVGKPEEHYDEASARSNVTYRITEGRLFKISSVGPAPPGLENRLAGFAGAPYDPASVAEVEAATSDHLRESGHPHPEVVAKPDINRLNATVEIKLVVKPGAQARISDIEVQGCDRTRKSFVVSRASLGVGKLFRASDIREAERRILMTGLFRSVQVSPGDVKQDSGEVPIFIYVDENTPGEVSVRAGTGSLDGWRVGADISYQNLFGLGGLVRLGGTVSRLASRGDFEVGVPWFLGTDLRPGVSFYYERQELPSFDVSGSGFAPSLVYPFTERHTISGGWRQAKIRTDDVDPGVPPGDLLDFEYRALFFATSLDFRDSALLPSQGFRITGSMEWAPASFASDIEFFKGLARADAYLGLPADLILAISFQGGVTRPLASTDEIPISLRHFAGGANTVRGFKYGTIGDSVDGEPTGGELYLCLQTEVRFPIIGDLHGAAFTDRGGVWLDPKDAPHDTRWSVGTGLRYYTPAGALSADLAWNVANEDDEDHLVFHFSIGFPF
jgi:outer membrane protein insertion porin family